MRTRSSNSGVETESDDAISEEPTPDSVEAAAQNQLSSSGVQEASIRIHDSSKDSDMSEEGAANGRMDEGKTKSVNVNPEESTADSLKETTQNQSSSGVQEASILVRGSSKGTSVAPANNDSHEADQTGGSSTKNSIPGNPSITAVTPNVETTSINLTDSSWTVKDGHRKKSRKKRSRKKIRQQAFKRALMRRKEDRKTWINDTNLGLKEFRKMVEGFCAKNKICMPRHVVFKSILFELYELDKLDQNNLEIRLMEEATAESLKETTQNQSSSGVQEASILVRGSSKGTPVAPANNDSHEADQRGGSSTKTYISVVDRDRIAEPDSSSSSPGGKQKENSIPFGGNPNVERTSIKVTDSSCTSKDGQGRKKNRQQAFERVLKRRKEDRKTLTEDINLSLKEFRKMVEGFCAETKIRMPRRAVFKSILFELYECDKLDQNSLEIRLMAENLNGIGVAVEKKVKKRLNPNVERKSIKVTDSSFTSKDGQGRKKTRQQAFKRVLMRRKEDRKTWTEDINLCLKEFYSRPERPQRSTVDVAFNEPISEPLSPVKAQVNQDTSKGTPVAPANNDSHEADQPGGSSTKTSISVVDRARIAEPDSSSSSPGGKQKENSIPGNSSITTVTPNVERTSTKLIDSSCTSKDGQGRKKIRQQAFERVLMRRKEDRKTWIEDINLSHKEFRKMVEGFCAKNKICMPRHVVFKSILFELYELDKLDQNNLEIRLMEEAAAESLKETTQNEPSSGVQGASILVRGSSKGTSVAPANNDSHEADQPGGSSTKNSIPGNPSITAVTPNVERTSIKLIDSSYTSKDGQGRKKIRQQAFERVLMRRKEDRKRWIEDINLSHKEFRKMVEGFCAKKKICMPRHVAFKSILFELYELGKLDQNNLEIRLMEEATAESLKETTQNQPSSGVQEPSILVRGSSKGTSVAPANNDAHEADQTGGSSTKNSIPGNPSITAVTANVERTSIKLIDSSCTSKDGQGRKKIRQQAFERVLMRREEDRKTLTEDINLSLKEFRKMVEGFCAETKICMPRRAVFKSILFELYECDKLDQNSLEIRLMAENFNGIGVGVDKNAKKRPERPQRSTVDVAFNDPISEPLSPVKAQVNQDRRLQNTDDSGGLQNKGDWRLARGPVAKDKHPQRSLLADCQHAVNDFDQWMTRSSKKSSETLSSGSTNRAPWDPPSVAEQQTSVMNENPPFDLQDEQPRHSHLADLELVMNGSDQWMTLSSQKSSESLPSGITNRATWDSTNPPSVAEQQTSVMEENSPFIQRGRTYNVAIVPFDYPEHKITEREADLIRNTLLERIGAQRGAGLRFVDTYEERGAVVFECADQFTVSWVWENASTIQPWWTAIYRPMSWEKANVLGKPKEISIQIPKMLQNLNLQALCERLMSQNPGLSTESWKVKLTDFTSCKFVFYIDDDSMEILKSLDFRPYLGFSRVYVDVIQD